MYKFSYGNLKEYSRHLSAFVAAEKQKGFAVEVGSDLGIKVTLSTLLGLKGSDQDQVAILVQVRAAASTVDSNGVCLNTSELPHCSILKYLWLLL